LIQSSLESQSDINPLDCNNFLIVFHSGNLFHDDAPGNRRKSCIFKENAFFWRFFPISGLLFPVPAL